MKFRSAASIPLGRLERASLVLVAALVWGSCTVSPPEAGESSLAGAAQDWNVLVVSVDTLRADRLGSFGYELRDTSPGIDRLVEGGVRFEQAMTHRSLTWPSLASMLTGLYPSGHGIVQNGYEFRDETPTLPKILQASGYETAAFLGNMCRANHAGWDAFKCTNSNDARVFPQARRFLEARDTEKPFLLWVHYFGAHGPYSNGQDWASTRLDPDYAGPLGPKKWKLNQAMLGEVPMMDADRDHLDALYDAAVMGTDRYVGMLLDWLREGGLLDKTLVLFVADHGEELADHNNYFYHACSVYSAGLNVPLAFIAPGVLDPAGSIDAPVEVADILPTMLDLLGVEPPPAMHGRSLIDYLDPSRPQPVERPAFSEFGGTDIRTVQHEGWKLVVNPKREAVQCLKDAPLDLFPIEVAELYELSSDPGEQSNVADDHRAKLQELRSLLEARFELIDHQGLDQDLPEDVRRKLEAMGYVTN